MRSFKEYLSESFMKHKYPFKIKIAGDRGSEVEEQLKAVLERYGVDTVKKASTSPIQSYPLDFPKLRNTSVTVYDAVLNYPTTQNELHEFLSAELEMTLSEVVVRNPNEPSEIEQNSQYEYDGSLLEDPDYKEHNNANHDDYYGTKYNINLLKELNKVAKAREKDLGIKIPKAKKDQVDPAGPKNNAPEYPSQKIFGPVGGKTSKKVSEVKSSAGSSVRK
jgi:hypothetical protein